MKKLRRFFVRFGRPLLFWLAALLVIGSLLWFRLVTLTPSLSPAEINARNQANSLQQISSNPINAPHKLGQYLMLKLDHGGALGLRSISALFGLLLVIILYRILRTWYTARAAILGSLLFICSSWFLHMARTGTPEILLAGALVLPWCGLLVRSQRPRLITLLVAAFLTAALCYVPGMVWFISLILLWQRKTIIQELKRESAWLTAALLLAAISLVSPLIMAIVRDPEVGRQLLGLPQQLDISTILNNLINIPKDLIVDGLDRPDVWLVGTPLIDVFSLAMFVLGAFALFFRLSLDRTKLLVGVIVGSLVLISLGGAVTLTLLLPFIYLLIASGTTLMLQQWLTVFPRNPLARSVGVGMLTALILLTCFYHLNRYFIAWPNAPQTKAAFISQP